MQTRQKEALSRVKVTFYSTHLAPVEGGVDIFHGKDLWLLFTPPSRAAGPMAKVPLAFDPLVQGWDALRVNGNITEVLTQKPSFSTL